MGRLARLPYPSEVMTDAIRVKPVGKTLVLLVPDPLIRTEDPPGSNNWRPSQADDVLSRAPGQWQGRIPGSNGYWELCSANGLLRTYNSNYQPGGPVGLPIESFLYLDVPHE